MPIRTKTDLQYVLNCPPGHAGGSLCSSAAVYVQVPIRDWTISPSQLNKSWQMGTAVPSQLFQDITFPELEFIFPYSTFRFKIKKVLNSTTVDFININSAKLVGNTFNTTNLVKERVFYNFQNLDNLSIGNHTISLNIEAYGIDSTNAEHYVESFYTEITIVVQAGSGISIDKNTYNLVYNKADDSLSGDEKIIVFNSDPVTVTSTEPFIEMIQNSVNSQRHLIFKKNSVLQSKNIGLYTSTVTIQIGFYLKNVNVNLEIINDTTRFYVNPESITSSLQKNLSESKTFTVAVSNPNNLNIEIQSKPSFIESAELQSGILKIITKNSASLSNGTYSGDVLLKAGTVIRPVKITLNIVQAISHDYTGAPYYFALDKNKVILNKTIPSATYVKMILKMYFKGFGEEYQELQEYDFPFFRGSTEIYPGKEIQDFFIRAKDITTSINPVYQFDLALVQMTFQEINDLDQVISIFELENIYFAPGRKPKCFPYFTDYPVRGTYGDSVIKLNCDKLSQKHQSDSLFENYNLPKPKHVSSFTVDQFTFLRNQFNNSVKKEIITAGDMQFVPLPDVERVIHVEWENQNFVFDWFSASGDIIEAPEIENTLGESKRYREEKFGSWKTKLLTINTGWILKQEIELITDLLMSRLCFIYIDEVRYKAYPVGKKNEMKNTANTKFMMDLEFKVLEDER